MVQRVDGNDLDSSDELPEELEEYAYELRIAEVNEDEDWSDGKDEPAWLVAQREARTMRQRRSRRHRSDDWVTEAFEDYLASRR